MLKSLKRFGTLIYDACDHHDRIRIRFLSTTEQLVRHQLLSGLPHLFPHALRLVADSRDHGEFRFIDSEQ